ncbi:unnamed protein product [Dracunculus medinensis]|uniref:Non-specific serine/threonine protein kinase n=1 Tax=Dracunculus medinensis TaxID=318479 RepID=A0A0N4U5X4_DRAME|nr:unnamed protein product [Dracunculus medinensis]
MSVTPPLSTVKNLIRQITGEKEGGSREKRIVACDRLCTLLMSRDITWEANFKWNLVLEDLFTIFSTRAERNFKKAVVKCVASVGFAMHSQYDQYIEILLKANKKAIELDGESHSEKERILILRSLSNSLRLIGSNSYESRIHPRVIEDLMTHINDYLNTNSSPSVLLPLLDICQMVANFFSSLFKKNFDDVVDFTIGWYVEPNQPKGVIKKCRKLLIDLKPFWLEVIPNAINFMNQFLDDTDSHIKDLYNENQDSEIAVEKICLLLQALATILNIVNSEPLNPSVVSFTKQIFVRVCKQLELIYTIEIADINYIFLFMKEVLWFALQISSSLDTLTISATMIIRMAAHPAADRLINISLISFFEKVLEKLPAEYLTQIFHFILDDQNIHTNMELVSVKNARAMSDFYSRLLLPKSLNTLQMAYKCVTNLLLGSISILKNYDCKEINYRALRHEEKCFLLLLKAFTDLAVIKNSFIAMMGLSPSLFTFLMVDLPIAEKWFINRHPVCHFGLLYLAKLHSEKQVKSLTIFFLQLWNRL